MSPSFFDRIKGLITGPRGEAAETKDIPSLRSDPAPARPLTDTAAELAAAVEGIDWDSAAVEAAWRQLGRDGKRARPEERLAALDILIARIKRSEVDDADGVAHVAISAGALVEFGAPALPLGDVLLTKLPAVLVAARRFANTCLAAMGDPPDDGEEEVEPPEKEVATYVDDRPIPWTVFRELLASDRPGAASLAYLKQWTLPTVATLTRDRTLLARATRDEAFCSAAASMDRSDAAWLHTLTGVQLEAPWLVLFPVLERGFRLTVDGVTTNFDLHALVADVLLEADVDATPNSPAVIAMLRGEADTCAERSVRGSWNLYTYRAAAYDVRTPADIPDDHWVWGEGQPRDVPAFEGVRTLLVGPPAYVRSWSAGRIFSALPARVHLVEELPRDTVRETLRRLADLPE